MTVTTFATATGAHTLPRVNLLPPEIAEERTIRRVKVGLAAGLVGCAAVVGLLYTTAHSSVGTAKSDLDTVTAQRASLQTQIGKLSGVTQTYAEVAARQAMLTQVMGDEIQWSHFLNDLSLTMPDHVWLASASFTQSMATAAKPAAGAPAGAVFDAGVGTVTFTGVALNHDDVAVWLETLAKQKGYANPYFTNSTEGDLYGHPVVNFQSTVTVTPVAYSGRYAKMAGN